MSPELPVTTPPSGATSACVYPLARATGINSESGFTEIHASTSGVNSPTSVVSCVARTALISVSPNDVAAAINPG